MYMLVHVIMSVRNIMTLYLHSSPDRTLNSTMYLHTYCVTMCLSLAVTLMCIINLHGCLITFMYLSCMLKSVNSNFTLAVHSPKFGQAKTHFLCHFGKKREKIWRGRDSNPWSVDQKSRANHYSICPLLENQQIYLCNIHCDETKSESWPVQILVSVLPE